MKRNIFSIWTVGHKWDPGHSLDTSALRSTLTLHYEQDVLCSDEICGDIGEIEAEIEVGIKKKTTLQTPIKRLWRHLCHCVAFNYGTPTQTPKEREYI